MQKSKQMDELTDQDIEYCYLILTKYYKEREEELRRHGETTIYMDICEQIYEIEKRLEYLFPEDP